MQFVEPVLILVTAVGVTTCALTVLDRTMKADKANYFVMVIGVFTLAIGLVLAAVGIFWGLLEVLSL